MITPIIICWMTLAIHSQTSTFVPLKLGNWWEWVIWLFIHAGIKVKPCQQKVTTGPVSCVQLTPIVLQAKVLIVLHASCQSRKNNGQPLSTWLLGRKVTAWYHSDWTQFHFNVLTKGMRAWTVYTMSSVNQVYTVGTCSYVYQTQCAGMFIVHLSNAKENLWVLNKKRGRGKVHPKDDKDAALNMTMSAFQKSHVASWVGFLLK